MIRRIVAPCAYAAMPFVVALTLASSAIAQTTFTETEPNSTKPEANAVTGIVAGDNITGTSTGNLIAVGLTLLQSADTFRVKTTALPLGIYRHALTLTTTGTVGHVGMLLGVSQANGVINPTSDVTFSTSITTSTPARTNIWYGFGKQEEVYYRVTGTTATTASYSATLTSTPVTPIAVTGTFNAGNVTVSSLNQGHNTDTEIYVYDGALNPIPLGHQDDPIGTVASPSTVTFSRVKPSTS
jgi:hypothetical protein